MTASFRDEILSALARYPFARELEVRDHQTFEGLGDAVLVLGSGLLRMLFVRERGHLVVGFSSALFPVVSFDSFCVFHLLGVTGPLDEPFEKYLEVDDFGPIVQEHFGRIKRMFELPEYPLTALRLSRLERRGVKERLG